MLGNNALLTILSLVQANNIDLLFIENHINDELIFARSKIANFLVIFRAKITTFRWLCSESNFVCVCVLMELKRKQSFCYDDSVP